MPLSFETCSFSSIVLVTSLCRELSIGFKREIRVRLLHVPGLTIIDTWPSFRRWRALSPKFDAVFVCYTHDSLRTCRPEMTNFFCCLSFQPLCGRFHPIWRGYIRAEFGGRCQSAGAQLGQLKDFASEIGFCAKKEMLRSSSFSIAKWRNFRGKSRSVERWTVALNRPVAAGLAR